MSVSGMWVKKMTAPADVITGAYIDYFRWVAKDAVAGDDLSVTFTTEEGSSVITSVADGANFLDIIWLNRRGSLTVDTIDHGYLEVFLRI